MPTARRRLVVGWPECLRHRSTLVPLSSPGPAAQPERFPSLRLWALLTIAAVAVIGLVYGANHGGKRTPGDTNAEAPPPQERPATPPRAAPPPGPATLVARSAGRLPGPVQAPAAAPLHDGRALLI